MVIPYKSIKLKTSGVVQLLAAIMVCFNYIVALVDKSGISIVLAILLIVCSLCVENPRELILSEMFIATVLWIVSVFAISFIVVPDTTRTLDYLERFLLYDLVAFWIGFRVENREKVIKNTIIIGLISMPLLLAKQLQILNSGNRMGFAYACLPVIIASLVGLRYDKKYLLFSIINIVSLSIKLYAYAPRGMWLIVTTMITLLIYYRICSGAKERTKFIASVFATVLLFLVILYVIMNLEYILVSINNYLSSSIGIRIYAIDKYIRYLSEDKVLNGRDVVWSRAIELIRNAPLFGSGIGYYEYISNGNTCHNLFLQSMCEAGIFFFFPSVVYVLLNLKSIFKTAYHNDEGKYYWHIFAFAIGIEMLFFSSVYWMYSPFWFFLGECLRKPE